MIFLSHNHKDKPIVEPIANELCRVFGVNEVFYDSWSIQPGDSLIGKMNEGLSRAKLFLLFLSKNSLTSDMVSLEWKNALLKSTSSRCKFVPVRLDDSPIPQVLSDTAYLDLYANGLDITLRQIIDIAKGINTYRQSCFLQSNLLATIKRFPNEVQIKITPRLFMEPTAIFLFLTPNHKNEMVWRLPSDSVYQSGFKENIQLNNGQILNGIYISVGRALTPQYPLEINFKATSTETIRINYLLKGENPRDFTPIELHEV